MTSFGFPTQTESQRIGRLGQIFAEYLVTKSLKWNFRSVHQEDDYGIDGYVDIVEAGAVTGKGLAIQVKCGDSYFSQRTPAGYKYTGSKKHLNLYLNLDLPVILLIADENKEEAYWVEFDVEKTEQTSSGWWIEIPIANRLAESTKLAWSAIAGPTVDYSEAIEKFWAVSAAIREADILALAIPKEEIETLSMHSVNSFLAKLGKNSELLHSKRNTIEVYFPDYDDDPREMHEIPEFRDWVIRSIDLGVPWFYFLNTLEPHPSLTWLYGCGCPVTVVKRTSEKHYLSTDPKDRQEWMEKNFSNINKFVESNGIPEELNEKACREVMGKYFAMMDAAQKEIG